MLPVGQALALIAELEQARMAQFERTVEDLKAQVKMLRDQGRRWLVLAAPPSSSTGRRRSNLHGRVCSSVPRVLGFVSGDFVGTRDYLRVFHDSQRMVGTC